MYDCLINEPGHRIFYKIACASEQANHGLCSPPKNAVFLATHSVPCKDIDQTARMQRLI